jgi:excisionase family DNA binding protein
MDTAMANNIDLRPTGLPDRQTLTTREVAAILGMHQVTVEKAVMSGVIPSFKVKNRRLIAKSVIEAVLLLGAMGDEDPFGTIRARIGSGTVRIGPHDIFAADTTEMAAEIEAHA